MLPEKDITAKKEPFQRLKLTYRQALIVSLLGGALMTIAGISGNLTIYFLTQEIVADYVNSKLIGLVFFIILLVVEFIAHAGGIAVIIGTLLIAVGHYRVGRAFSSLGTGLGFIGLIVLIVIEVVTGTILEDLFLTLLGIITFSGALGISGFILAIVSRRYIIWHHEEVRPKTVLLGKEHISSIIVISISTFFFVLFESILIPIFSRLIFLNIYIYIMWQTIIISIYFNTSILTVYFKYFKLTFINFILVLSAIGLLLLSYLHALIVPKVILIFLFVASSIGDYYFMKFKHIRKEKNLKRRKKGLILIAILSSTTFTSVMVLTIPQRIEITPKTSPELIFFTEPFQMPNSNDTYELWGDNKFSFMPSLGLHVLNSSSLMERLKLAIVNEVNLYINLINPDADFTNIYNAYRCMESYTKFKEWFENESIFDSPYIKAFTFDAEPSKSIQEDNKGISRGNMFDGINYLIDNFPSRSEINNATECLQALIDLAHSDDKEIGIIRTRPNLDENDYDGDLELISDNIYSLDLEWDFSVTMLYRSQAIKKSEPGSAQDTVTNLLLTVFGGTRTDNAFVYSKSYFYFFTGIEQSNGDVKAKEKYIFLGNYKASFKETSYIKNEGFLYDLDICRHFSEEKVFLYNYEGFVYHYGEAGLKKLIDHNNQHESWILEYNSVALQADIILLIVLVSIDRFLSLDPAIEDRITNLFT